MPFTLKWIAPRYHNRSRQEVIFKTLFPSQNSQKSGRAIIIYYFNSIFCFQKFVVSNVINELQFYNIPKKNWNCLPEYIQYAFLRPDAGVVFMVFAHQLASFSTSINSSHIIYPGEYNPANLLFISASTEDMISQGKIAVFF
jgi:uncharacterized metal-binding protein